MTAFDWPESGPGPMALAALTVNVEVVALVSPVMVAVVAGGEPVMVVAVCAVTPIYGVIVYPVIARPPFAGAVQDTVAEAFPAVADTPVGAAGAVGAPAALRATSSRYMDGSSGGLEPSWWTLNHRTTVCPAYALVSKLTWVQACALELDLNTDASVVPDVLRISASCQSNLHADPEHSVSVVAGQYENVNVDAPEGTDTVRLRLLSPKGSVPEALPRNAAAAPVWALPVVLAGVTTPPDAQPESPLSKPPLNTTDRVDRGVAALEAADVGPLPAGLDALTVKV